MLPLSVKLYALAALLLIAAAGLEVHRRGVVSRERSRLSLLRDDVELFVDALSTSLKNPESCGLVLGGRTPTPGATEAVTLDYAYDPAHPGPLTDGTEAWPGTQLRRLTMTLPKSSDMRTTFGGHELRRFRARLDAAFTVGDRFARGVPAGIDLILWLDPGGRIDSCFGPLSVGSVCNMMGGYYDAKAHPPEPRCHQIVRTTVGTDAAEVFRGSCRVSALEASGERCHPRHGALTFQQKMGYGTRAQTLCRVCE